MSATGDLHVGVDIGGTFTDVVAFSPGRDDIHVRKVPTRRNPEEGVVEGLQELFRRTEYSPADVELLAHGSTITVNTLIERTGAKTALLHTAGFDAIPVARRGDRPQAEVFNPRYQDPEPYVPHRYVRGVPERVGPDGEVLEPLDEETTAETIRALKAEGVDSIAVCFLFSFLNPDHERRVRELVADIHPDCRVSLSSDVAPRIREYPRLSTTTIDAYVAGEVLTYTGRLERRLAGIGVEPETAIMMLSHGGVVAFDALEHRPVQTMLSGPAAGVRGALFAVAQSGTRDVVTMDMGGTSCDIAVAPDGEAETTTETEIQGFPVAVPMIDIRTIGAGGGAVARVEGDRLRVGPESAGADPGPVCYGRGGTEVTVTDANAVLGRLDPEGRLAGDLRIDAEAAERAVAEQVADPLGLTVPEAAAGVIDVVNSQMEKQLSVTLVEGGHDPREFTLVPFGGAGPMHAPAIAERLSLERVVIPAMPGAVSAVGHLTSDRKRIYERSRVDALPDAPVERTFADLEADARADLPVRTWEAATVERELQLRYEQELYTLGVPVRSGDAVETLRERFETAHRETYGHTTGKALETMTYRVTVRTPTDGLPPGVLGGGAPGSREWRDATTRQVYFDGEFRTTPVYRRSEIPAGEPFRGPAILEQMDTTVVVQPGTAGEVDGAGNVVLTVGGD